MGKKSKYPEYSSGTITVNGRDVSTTKRDKDNNIVSSNYNMSKTEKKIYDSTQNNLYSSLGNLFTISDNQRKEWNKQLNAIKQQGTKQIDSIYKPMENNLKNDISARFGNLDNSIFLDNLNKITDKRAEAVADLSDSILATQNNLYSEELRNRINTITLLNNLNSAMNSNILNFATAANSNANSGNSYNNAAYNANSSSGSWFSDAMSFGGTMLSFLS